MASVTSSVNGDNNSIYPVVMLGMLNAHSKCSINDSIINNYLCKSFLHEKFGYVGIIHLPAFFV